MFYEYEIISRRGKAVCFHANEYWTGVTVTVGRGPIKVLCCGGLTDEDNAPRIRFTGGVGAQEKLVRLSREWLRQRLSRLQCCSSHPGVLLKVIPDDPSNAAVRLGRA
jgi:hypothetical protein